MPTAKPVLLEANLPTPPSERAFCSAVEKTALLPRLGRLLPLPTEFAAKVQAQPIPDLVLRGDARIVPIDPSVCNCPGACLFITTPDTWRNQTKHADFLLELAQPSARTAAVQRGELSRETTAMLRRPVLKLFVQDEIEATFGSYDTTRPADDESRFRTIETGLIGLRR